ncbi:DUF4123 domain-containing protein [Swingsia samuiensis]|uniref:DUF4123 domain-containing protein n=1 Tax=Swingsia samuiensis TaxID=1293412 RepID=A0A4Y6UN54_9PROT|nr:DUF4123 domain-containing protein [Swingsia samuiensis]QDH18098.1 DUF4123 domain-containing protein [Swingsia samuiensis]
MPQDRSIKEIRNKLSQWSQAPIFVALDGALFNNLPRLLDDAGFNALSLFIEQTDPESIRVSPQFVSVPHNRLEEFLNIPKVSKGCVFWNAPNCEPMSFYRHLRSLSMVRIPYKKQTTADAHRTRMVFFRHFDPATVAITLPVLRPEQRARLFGPAQSLLIDAPEGVLEAKKQSNWPPPEKGFLTFDAEQMARISEALALRSKRAIASYLRDTASQKTAHLSDNELLTYISQQEKIAHEYGVTSEAGIGRFCWLQLMSDGKFIQIKTVQIMIRSPENSPDDNLIKIMDQIAYIQSQRESGL